MPTSSTSTTVPGANRQYTLGDWDNRSAVRSKKTSYLLPPVAEVQQQLHSKDWFPPSFIHYFKHPVIRQSSQQTRHRLAANHLVYFLNYTTILEHKIVNRSVETLIHDELGIELPHAMKIAALQLYTDEGYHALFSFKLAEQVARFYDMPVWDAPPKRIRLLLDLLGTCTDEYRPLMWFFVGFVSETIIAKELLDLTGNTLVCTVYQMFREHLEDEARHSRYFSEVFQYLWPRLSPELQQDSARHLIDIIFVFSEVDEQWLGASLASAGICALEATDIIQQLQAPGARAQRARSSAAATLQAMKRAGFFEQDAHRTLFSQSGLIDA
ncbi:diiron oxygenase [Pseudomonas frederiksbergensis]|uniref:Aminobenzoate oxygenase n=1 Tax=Pseudomonas frederiksbergensis TaxID=104087 RepID=A0A423KRF0_9PSED|nr:diiron oxygenase [Pseudomonas frederiksbergensis]RON57928.1 aminobenzoate oxygenase [Pseudomonas frederiksbergensis]